MSLDSGTRLGPYEILTPIGKGGMGEVYRARDTKLGRDVAIKVLPDELAADEERVARFEREAKLLASLNHPNIASIHGFEDSDGVKALVLELVEGPTLAERIALGPVPVDEAVVIAKQIADALEAGHEAGVIHRDLKPANIKLKEDGTVKVLDYGLAKALEEDATARADAELSQSPTLTRQATQVGVILGTAAYMSPEQAKGKRVDKRTDIFAFGAVLYEMLTGRRAFAGEDVSDVLASVLKTDPDWGEIPSGIEPRLERLLRRCLRKDRKKRLRDVGDLRNEIEEIEAEPAVAAEPAPTAARTRERVAWAAMAFFGLSTAALAVAHFARTAPESGLVRFSVLLPPELERFSRVQFAVSPDGRTIASVGLTGVERYLGVRSIDSMEWRLLAGTEDAADPFWSPDSQFIGYFAEDKLKRVRVSGGPSEVLCDADDSFGGSWNRDGIIVIGSREGILRVQPGEGLPTLVTEVDETRGERDHRYPQFLPDNNHFLFLAHGRERDEGGIYVGSLDSAATKRVLDAHFKPLYVRSGYVLSLSEDELWAWSFDVGALAVSESAFPLPERVEFNTGNAGFGASVSETGTLVYNPRDSNPRSESVLVWRSASGRETEVLIEEPLRFPAGLRLSPDGRDLAVTSGDRDGGELWVYPVDGRPAYPLASDGAARRPVWSPNGARIAFGSSLRPQELFWVPSDGSGLEPEPLSSTLGRATPVGIRPGSWSPDGNELIVDSFRVGILAVPLGGEGEAEARLEVETDALAEGRPRLSPDGSLLAYVSTASGRPEVWIRPYPGPGAPVRVTASGGADPVWSRDGKVLYYIEGALGTPNVRLMGVRITTGPAIDFETPKVFVDGGFVTDSRDVGAYDVAPDGRFVMVQSTAVEPTDTTLERDQLNVVLNWFHELERLAPND